MYATFNLSYDATRYPVISCGRLYDAYDGYPPSYIIHIGHQFTVDFNYSINIHSLAGRPTVFCEKDNLPFNGIDLPHLTGEFLIFAAILQRIWYEVYQRYHRVMTIMYHFINQR